MNGYVGVVVIAWVQGRTDPAMLGRTMSFMMLGSVVAAPLSLALAAIVVDTHAGPMFVAAGLLVVGSGDRRLRQRTPAPDGLSRAPASAASRATGYHEAMTQPDFAARSPATRKQTASSPRSRSPC